MPFRLRWIGLLMLAAIAAQGAMKAKQPFFFFVLADPQFGMYTHDQGFEREAKNFETVIAAANRLHPAFVIVCGDLVNKAQDAAETRAYLEIAGKLDRRIRLYNVAGNHDVGNAPTPALLSAYRKVFGPDYYSFRADHLEGIVLDSQLISNPINAPAAARQQEAWLKAVLAQARRQHIRHLVVFQHISWFLRSPEEKDNYFNIPRRVRLRYLKLFRRFGVHCLFAGHYHRNAQGVYQKIPMITNGPVGKPLGKDPSGFGIVCVRRGGLDYTYVPLTRIPERVNGCHANAP